MMEIKRKATETKKEVKRNKEAIKKKWKICMVDCKNNDKQNSLMDEINSSLWLRPDARAMGKQKQSYW